MIPKHEKLPDKTGRRPSDRGGLLFAYRDRTWYNSINMRPEG